MHRMRTAPPTELAGRPVQRTDDLIDGDPARGFVPSDVLTWHLDGARVVVRPSGTEPKLKAYVEVVEPVASRDDLPAARQRATAALDELVAATATTTGLT
jgi:phosphomannomutase